LAEEPESEQQAQEVTDTNSWSARFERLVRITLLVFIFAGVGFLSAVTAIRISIRGRIVTMPNMVGAPLNEAAKMLAARGLQLRVADRVYSSLPVNSVVRQSPPSGEEMKVSQDAHVILSLGPLAVKIPSLEGKSLRAARISLLQAGLQLGEVSSIDLTGPQQDTVLRQDPPAGADASSPHVDLLIAGGAASRFYVMPAVVGLDQPEANRILSAAGLRVAKVTRISQTGSAKGAVIGQTPPGGQRIPGDATVELGVAD
jgi:eukaryotic-like serine/threonine-protein kinase